MKYKKWTGKEVCSFCGKKSSEQLALIKGMDSVYICDDCILICVKILTGKAVSNEDKS